MKAIEELRELMSYPDKEDRLVALSQWIRRNTVGFGTYMTLQEGSGKEVDSKLAEIKNSVKKLTENVLEDGVTTTVDGGKLTVEILLIRDAKK